MTAPKPGDTAREDRERHSWVEAQLERCTYRPGWTIELDDVMGAWQFPWPQQITIRIRYRAEDARYTGPGERPMVTVGWVQAVPVFILLGRDEDAFALWLLSTLISMERHETREWFRRDGEVFDDPHAPGATT